MMCVVQKPFTGNGEDFQRNQLIDASGFRNHQALISQHYLRPATQDEINSAYEEDSEPEPAPPVSAPARQGFFGRKSHGLKARVARR